LLKKLTSLLARCWLFRSRHPENTNHFNAARREAEKSWGAVLQSRSC
jgi:hypothetical protein